MLRSTWQLEKNKKFIAKVLGSFRLHYPPYHSLLVNLPRPLPTAPLRRCPHCGDPRIVGLTTAAQCRRTDNHSTSILLRVHVVRKADVTARTANRTPSIQGRRIYGQCLPSLTHARPYPGDDHGSTCHQTQVHRVMSLLSARSDVENDAYKQRRTRASQAACRRTNTAIFMAPLPRTRCPVFPMPSILSIQGASKRMGTWCRDMSKRPNSIRRLEGSKHGCQEVPSEKRT